MAIHLKSIATAHPPYAAEQDQILRFVLSVCRPDVVDPSQVTAIFENTGIGRRYLSRPAEWFAEPHSATERQQAYIETATDLFVQSATEALAAAGWAASDVDAVVTISSTGIASPGIEARAMPRMGFRPDAARIPVFGLGCAGGVCGLGIAGQLAAGSGGRVLLVCIELCSLSYRATDSKANVIASALFGDGAAAITVAGGETAGQGNGMSMAGFYEHLWPETVDITNWSVDDLGLDVVLSRDLPAFVEEQIAEVADRAIASQGLLATDIARTVFHPGGAKVLRAFESALGLADGALDAERATLREAGNMSSPTVFFVLKRVLEDGHQGRLMLAALGPGFTASFAVIEA